MENIPTKDSSRDELILGEMKSDDMILYLFSFWLSARHYLRVVEFNLKKFPAKTRNVKSLSTSMRVVKINDYCTYD